MNQSTNNNDALTTTPISSTPKFGYQLGVSAGDIIAMGVTQIEAKCQAVIDAEAAVIESLDKDIAKAGEKVSEAVTTFGDEKLKDLSSLLNKPLKICKGTSLTTMITASIVNVEVKKSVVAKIQCQVSLVNEADDDNERRRNYHAPTLHQETVAIPASIKKLQKVVEELREERDEHSANAAKAQKEMYSMDKHQRRLTAKLTQQQLSQSEEGKDLVAGMDHFLEDMGFGGLPQLPAPKKSSKK